MKSQTEIRIKHRKDSRTKLHVLDLDEIPEVRGGRYAIIGVNEDTRMAYLDDAGYENKAEAVRIIRVSEVIARARTEGTIGR